MAASPLSDIAIPDAGVAAAFTAGERALTTGHTAVGTQHLSLPIDLLGGLYTIKVAASVPASVWVGTDAARRVGTTGALTVTEADVFTRQGRHKLTVILSNTAGGACWVAVSIWRDAIPVYVSTATNWRWDIAPVSDLPDLGDERLTLPVWTMPPNWASGITERLTFATEVLTSEVEVEQRRSLMTYPYRAWEASFLRAGINRMRLDTFISGVGTTRMLAPFWPEQLPLQGLLTAATPTIQFTDGTLYQREFATGSLALLTNGDPMVYDVVRVGAVSSTTITLDVLPQRDWQAGARLTPLYEVRISSQSQMTMHTDRVGTLGVRFDCVAPLTTIAPSWGYCAPLWRYKLDRAQSITIDYSRNTFTLNAGTGPMDLVDTSGETRMSVRGRITIYGRESLTAYRAFLAMARGRSQRFWWPSGTADMDLAGDSASGTTVMFKPSGYSDWITQPQDAKTMVAFVYTDDTPTQYRRIVGVEKQTNGNDLITFDRALPPLTKASIERVSFVLPVRFDQDGFEIHHVTDNAAAVTAAVVVRSADITGLPDIECWITSRPYPVQAMDAVTTEARLTGGTYGGLPPQLESVNTAAGITGGQQLTVLQSTSFTPESISTAAGITGGTLVVAAGYADFDAGVESVTTSAGLTAGTIATILIPYSMDTEFINTSAGITGGTIT